MHGAREHDLVVVLAQDVEEEPALLLDAIARERADDSDDALAQRRIGVAGDLPDELANVLPVDGAGRDEPRDRFEDPATHLKRLGVVARELGERGPDGRRSEVLEEPGTVLPELGVRLVAK